MNVIETAIPDVLVFEPRIFGDERGYFFESFRQDFFEKHAGDVHFVQDNESRSHYGVLRGLHFQKAQYSQGKLVRVVEGAVLDVAVDIRKGSPWFGKHVAMHLNAEKKNMMWIPRGFAHGFVVLSETAVFTYKCDNYYAPEADAGIRWNDPALGIEWGVDASVIEVSEKDANLALLAEIGEW
ncbi:dTDP-4-dehydrorhamnose 3,5-epimerase [Prosthecochloris aestuarii DSM 271]|uniref:dTDP-4-dehydrorhamnose 3,5-epimerase n=1 Tax=Prosthecochloris aestuarii (strain DSM 271 / SK 413) TaxID=290512 RepID=B4S3K4_PROA2|nr:dTDP-4-dehydrorhamnose 3,5-epimerase [Prosthecochloris aestuarii]ACF46743.1 dTDP-4-dehydrorhamnose 3,5-epimerase [Prosthecochloris aestuarii DSM 271]